MKKNTLFVILIAMLCLAAITAAVSADNDGYNSYCNIDQYGCWVTEWDKELDEPTGKKIYVQFWSEEAREFFMGEDSDATVAPLPRKYGAAMTMVKGDEEARGAWKSGLWGFEVYEEIGWQLRRGDFPWIFFFENNKGERVNYADYTLENTYYPTLTVTYYTGDGRQKVGTQVYYLEHPEIGKGKKFEDFEAYAEFIDKTINLTPDGKGIYNNDITIDGEYAIEMWGDRSFEENYIAKTKDGASDIVVKYCNNGHIVDGGCVLPDSLIPGFSNVPAEDSGWYVHVLTDRSGNIIYVDKDGNYTYDDSYENDYIVIDHVIWANPAY